MMKRIELTNFNRMQRIMRWKVASCIVLVLSCHFLFPQDSWEGEKGDLQVQEAELMGFGEKFVELMNTSSVERAMELGKEIFVERSASGWVKSFRDEYGTVQLGRIRLTIGDQYQTVHVIVKAKKLGEWRNFQLVFGNTSPKRTGRINIVLAAQPLTLPSGEVTDPVIITELKDYMQVLADESGLSASLLLKKGEKTLLQGIYGMANRETGRANTSETPFNLASGSKMFTAVAILRLVQEGKIKLNDPIVKYIPKYPDKQFAERATVAHLLTHSSGLGDYWDNEFEQHWNEIKELKDYIPWVAKQPLRHPNPGTGAYSNSGFILLGLIIEQVSGANYYTHVQNSIFDPLGMTNTGFFGKDQEDRIAIGYMDLSKTEAIRTSGGSRGSSAGGGYSTASDMFKFRSALLNHQLLNKEMLDLSTREQAVLDSGMKYGYGFSVNDVFAHGFGHGGQGPGSASTFAIDKEADFTLIILSNKLNGAYAELMFTLKELLSR